MLTHLIRWILAKHFSNGLKLAKPKPGFLKDYRSRLYISNSFRNYVIDSKTLFI